MKTTQKELKRMIANGTVVDVTNADKNTINDISHGRTVIAYSAGMYGLNGVLVKAWNGTLYASVGRTLNTMQLAY